MGARIMPDSAYVDGVGLDQSWWRAIDAAQEAAWNGDLGSSHTASAPIVIGGAGVMWAGPTQFQGVGPSAGVRTPFGSGKRIVLGDSDYPQYQSLAANAVRTMLTACGRARDRSYASSPSFLARAPVQATMRYSGGGASLVTTAGSGYLGGARFSMPLRVHHLGTLFAANFGFTITTPRTLLPLIQPRFRVVRVDAFGNITVLQNNYIPIPGYASQGFVSLTAASAAAYYNTGASQLFTYTFDSALNNPAVIVDITKYAYIAQVEDEVGSPPPSTAGSWFASFAYLVGTSVIPSAPNGYYYTVTTPGTSGTSEPVWPTTPAATVTDGSVVWTCSAKYGNAYPGNKWESVSVLAVNIPDARAG